MHFNGDLKILFPSTESTCNTYEEPAPREGAVPVAMFESVQAIPPAECDDVTRPGDCDGISIKIEDDDEECYVISPSNSDRQTAASLLLNSQLVCQICSEDMRDRRQLLKHLMSHR